MAYFLISYDLHWDRKYEPLYALMEHWRAVRLHQSLWLVELPVTAEVVKNAILLGRFVDSDDSVAVLQLKPGAQWALERELPGSRQWLLRRLPKWWW